MAYQTDEYGNTYYVPEAQYGGKTGDWDWGSGGAGLLSGGAAGAQLGAMFGMPVLGGLVGGGLGGLYGLITGGQEQDRNRAAEQAAIEYQQAARKRMEAAFADERNALETQRQLAEQTNPAEAIYGREGQAGLLQMQQAQLAQQAAAQQAQARRGLASRGLLGSGMEAGAMGALAGQQAAQQAQLQANALQQYQQQQMARQQQLGQLGMQGAQMSRQQAAARSEMDRAALQGQQQQAAQIAARNQALLQSGLQSVQAGLGAYQQAQALANQRENINALRALAKLEPLKEGDPFAGDKAVADWFGGLFRRPAAAPVAGGAAVVPAAPAAPVATPPAAPAAQLPAAPVAGGTPAASLASATPAEAPPLEKIRLAPGGHLSPAQRQFLQENPTFITDPRLFPYMRGSAGDIPVSRPSFSTPPPMPGIGLNESPTYQPGPLDNPVYPRLDTLPPRQPRQPKKASAAGGLTTAYRRPDQSQEFFG